MEDDPAQAFLNGCLQTPLADSIEDESVDSLNMVRMMLDAGLDLSAVIKRIRILVEKGRARVYVSETALLVAIGARQLDKVRLLIDKGADINARPTRGVKRTALQKAAEVGAYKILEYLINLGTDINAPAAGTGGATALQFAAVHGFVGIADRLLREGADPNAPAALLDGRTALEGAAEHGRLDMVQLLRNFGARIDGPHRSQYEQALCRASDNGHFAVVDLLKSYDTDNASTGAVGGQLSHAPSMPYLNEGFIDEFILWDGIDST